MDTIFISDLRLDILIGVYDWEKKVPQKVQFDLEIGLPGAQGAASDRLGDTIDYAAVVSRIETSLAENHFGLLEKLAEHVARDRHDANSSRRGSRSASPSSRALKNVKRLGVTIERGTKA